MVVFSLDAALVTGTHPAEARRAAPQRHQRRPATGSSGQQQACEPSISIRTGHSACQDPYEDHPHIMQKSMPKPVRPNMATATPLGPQGPDGGEAARRVAQAGRATIRRQNPSSRGRGTEGLYLGAASLHSGHLRGIGPEPGTRKDPDPRRRSSRGSGLRIGLPARQWRLHHARGLSPSQRPSWRYGLRRTCRLVTGRLH
jgi:hypothetical protein